MIIIEVLNYGHVYNLMQLNIFCTMLKVYTHGVRVFCFMKSLENE